MTIGPEVIALAVLPALLWGFIPILDKRGMAGGGGSLQASLMVVIVDSTIYWLALLALSGGSAFDGLTPEILAVFVAAGVVGSGFGRLTIYVGVDRVGASLNSAIISSRPLFATLIALVWLDEPLGPATAVGVVILVAGLAVLARSKGGDLSGWRPIDLWWPIASAALFAFANVARRFGMLESPLSVLEAVTLNETAGLVALGGYALATRERSLLEKPRETYVYFAGSGLVTTVAMLSLMAALGLAEGRIAVVDSLVATAPLFTVVFAAVFLRRVERVTKGVVLGAGLIVAGAVMITT
ncbi:DMT family transporter [Halovivax limisalsi]|uniref:DMT family transporter n=1 Tax=Halovivax limisalsi TaxID=1453760 RepID=UPI001FFDDC6C|nr:DMT family transporter [Halovivax limisalsi]